MWKRNIILAVALLGTTSFTEVAAASAPTDFGPLDNIPFGATIYRLGDILINRVGSAVFGNGASARSTRVYIYNHFSGPLYLISSSFSSGGFSTGSHPAVILGKSVHVYSVESYGVATGVTDADLRFGNAPNSPGYCLRVVTSNPYIGSNSARAESFCGLTARPPISTVGDNNEVYVDVW